MKKILGITIGPILETIYESKKIDQISKASLFFSTLMKDVLLEVLKIKNDYEVISPFLDEQKSLEKEIFLPDRAVIEIKNNLSFKDNIEKIKEIHEKILEEKNLISFKDYINFNIVAREIEDTKITDIFSDLDGIELIKNFPTTFNFKNFTESVDDYLGTKTKLSKKYNVDYKISEVGEENAAYRAVIALDIDNMSKFSKSMVDEIKKLSKAISEYIESLNNFLSEDNRGLVIYSAGDDVLAILNPRYIFKFINFACENLKEKFKDFYGENKELSVSLGIFICYEKFPIKEAIEKAHEQLFANAKKEKNSASLLFQKHSGQSFSLTLNHLINKEEENLSLLKNILKEKVFLIIENKDNKKDEERLKLLNTIIQKISLNIFVFRAIIKDKEKIKHYLNNLFEFEDKKTVESLDEKHPIKLVYNLLCLLSDEINIETKSNKDEKDIFLEKIEDILSCIKIFKFYSGRKGKAGEENGKK